MRTAEEVVRDHPNATFVFSTTPLTALAVWALLKLGLAMPQAISAAIGSLISGSLLIFRTAIQKTGSAVWELGIVGCIRRIWRGNQSPPPSI